VTSGSLFDADVPDPGLKTARPMLSRPQLLGMRVLVALYVLTVAILFATNIRPVGNAVFRISSMHAWARLTLGILVSAMILTFFLLLALCLHHFARGHLGPKPAAWWFWVIVLTNFIGIVVYYLGVIEPELRAFHAAERHV
jgi:hypothetical protein